MATQEDNLQDRNHQLPRLSRSEDMYLDEHQTIQMKSNSSQGKKCTTVPQCQPKIRPKTVSRSAHCKENVLVTELISLSSSSSSQIQRRREIVVFLPTEDKELGLTSTKQSDLVEHLPDINATHLKEFFGDQENADKEKRTVLRPTQSRNRIPSREKQ